MSQFLEIEFPRVISFKTAGGPGYSTTVNQGLSAQEDRNANWQYSRGEWKIGLITPASMGSVASTPASGSLGAQGFVNALLAFFHNCKGRAYSFRFYDGLDNKAVAQPLVAVTGGVQLAITRSVGSENYVQLISKPITSSPTTTPVNYLGHALPNTVFLTGTKTPVAVDPTTGLVTDGTPAGVLVDFQFDYPVRFDVDKLPLTPEPSPVGAGRPIISIGSIPLVEVAPPNF